MRPCLFQIITDESFAQHQGFDLASFDEKNWPPSELPTLRVLKAESYLVFKRRVAQHFNLPEQQMRLWVLVNRQNKTVRPDTPVPENDANLSELKFTFLYHWFIWSIAVEQVRNSMAARQTDLRLYLDVLGDPTKPEAGPNSIMIFLKFFDVSKQTLYGVGKTYVLRTSKVGDLVAIINERMRWPPTMAVKLYEEIKPGMIEVMKPKLTFLQSEIQDGDIICFQAELSEKEIYDLEAQGLYATPPQYYDFLQNRVLLYFKPKHEDPNEENPEFDLILSKKMNYDTVSGRPFTSFVRR